MKNKKYFAFLILLVALSTTGCATGRSYQSDLDTLNSRISALQSEMSAKDGEIAGLRAQLSSGDSAKNAELARLESENRALSDRLNSALSKLEATRATKKVEAKIEESDLK
jgi:predicted  nucleic acid-binding Zn-ribbon protein